MITLTSSTDAFFIADFRINFAYRVELPPERHPQILTRDLLFIDKDHAQKINFHVIDLQKMQF